VAHRKGDRPYTSDRKSVVPVSHAYSVPKRSNILDSLIITASRYDRALVLPGPGTSEAMCAGRHEIVGSDSRIVVVHAARPFNASGRPNGGSSRAFGGGACQGVGEPRGNGSPFAEPLGACCCIGVSCRLETCCFKCMLVKSARYTPARATMRTGVQGWGK
jgi:hypothetical protein